MTIKTKPLTLKILEHAHELPEGAPLQTAGLLHLGNRPAVGRALSRLEKWGELFRIGHGIYVLPLVCRWGKSAPLAYPTVKALAEQRGERIVVNCLSAANLLGLTTQNPMTEIYLTSGPTRNLYFGKRVVELRHAPDWQLVFGETKAGKALRALEWFGADWREHAVMRLRRSLDKRDRDKLAGLTMPMPAWVARAVREIAHG